MKQILIIQQKKQIQVMIQLQVKKLLRTQTQIVKQTVKKQMLKTTKKIQNKKMQNKKN